MLQSVMARILLSEADPDVRRLLTLLLERLGHEPMTIPGAASPVPVADLMLLEPGSSVCLAEARRAREAQPDLPIVCVSVLPEEARFLALGPLGYLTKPFALEDLRSAVDCALSRAATAVY
jgi:CheY-like chemotaxis protein